MSRGKNRWDQAIEDAKDTIAKCQRKIESMKAAIELFQESRDANEPWAGSPNQQSDNHAATS